MPLGAEDAFYQDLCDRALAVDDDFMSEDFGDGGFEADCGGAAIEDGVDAAIEVGKDVGSGGGAGVAEGVGAGCRDRDTGLAEERMSKRMVRYADTD